MSLRPSVAALLLAGLAVVLVAIIVHVSTILMVPRLAPEDAFARIVGGLPLAQPVALPPAASAQNAVPFRDAAMQSAVCRYNLSDGPLRVTATVVDDNLTAVTFHSRYGRAFYGLTDSSAVDGKIEIVLVTADQLARLEAKDSDDEPAREIRVTAPGDEGFVEFDVLPRPGRAERAPALPSMSCKVERDV